MTQSVWEKFVVEEKIVSILKEVKPRKPFHHFRRPFLSPYQIAIRFKQKYPDEFKLINMPIGGKKIDSRDTFSRYIAWNLSRRIRDNKISNIEGAFLHLRLMAKLQFKDDSALIESSLGESLDLSIFRYIE